MLQIMQKKKTITMTNKVVMQQTGRYSWKIVSEKGHLIQENLTFPSAYKAEEYIKNYISSFLNWHYRMALL
jgi:hypothetical protein